MKQKKMKKIGLLGGVGPQATSFIYNEVIKLAQLKYGAHNNDDFPQIIIDSIPVPDFIGNKGKIETAKKMLIEATRDLSKAGCTSICIGSNTIHILLQELSAETRVPFISMVSLVAKHCSDRGLRRVGLIGSPVLMESGIYEHELHQFGIEMILPTTEQVFEAEKVIRAVLAGTNANLDKTLYVAALNDFFTRGAEATILGCTELPLALNYEALGSRMINSDAILAEGIVNYYYKD